jgi:hypothetical protein
MLELVFANTLACAVTGLRPVQPRCSSGLWVAAKVKVSSSLG